jgi:hypothetical protein
MLAMSDLSSPHEFTQSRKRSSLQAHQHDQVFSDAPADVQGKVDFSCEVTDVEILQDEMCLYDAVEILNFGLPTLFIEDDVRLEDDLWFASYTVFDEFDEEATPEVDAIECGDVMRCHVCPVGHTLEQKTVTGSWFSNKHCSGCSKELTKGASRFSCKQCAFHLCQSCIDQGTESEIPIERKSKKRKTCKLDAEDHKSEAATPTKASKALPVQETKSGWCIRGIYEHQGLKMGLRQLSTRPEVLREPATIKRSYLLKEKLLMDLADGKVDLTTIHANDLNAAQGDVPKLSVRQLLSIAVKYDSQSKGAPGEFMMIVENALYEKLGECATATADLSCACDDVDDVRRLGREAVLLVAAAAAIPCSSTWSWWIMGGRVFFDAQSFTRVKAFPKAGVLEFFDYSKVERFAGRSIDWQVRLTENEGDLRNVAEQQLQVSSVAKVSLEAITQCRAALRKTSEPHQSRIRADIHPEWVQVVA